ncbi:MAG: hypothetical protein M1837_002602 [Sclerophora amabilis]|nr:MAG: hypothetical protein M1837_002602 [Sclerophora amabilis]
MIYSSVVLRFGMTLASFVALAEAVPEHGQAHANLHRRQDGFNSSRSADQADVPFVNGTVTKGNGRIGNGDNGNGPNGIGPTGNGPTGNGPNGDGPTSNGPNGNGPTGNGPNGNARLTPGEPSTGFSNSSANSRVGQSAYTLQDDYSPSDFFSQFTFFTEPDPTHGFVEYVDESTAQGGGLIQTNSDSVYIGVDHDNQAPSGRQSVRLTSKNSYTHGLFIADIAHFPGGICGTWPALWTLGPDWPSSGEIDILEGVNDNAKNQYTLHSAPGCSMSGGTQTGEEISTICDAAVNGNAGCSVADSSSTSYGDFNDGEGGVFAVEWTSEHINLWFFPRSNIPGDALGSNPDPLAWGTPVANFQGPCDIDSKFKEHQIIFDTTFCGDWAGNVWTGSTCAANTGSSTCIDFVANNPAAFTDAYWTINSLKVFQSA